MTTKNQMHVVVMVEMLIVVCLTLHYEPHALWITVPVFLCTCFLQIREIRHL